MKVMTTVEGVFPRIIVRLHTDANNKKLIKDCKQAFAIRLESDKTKVLKRKKTLDIYIPKQSEYYLSEWGSIKSIDVNFFLKTIHLAETGNHKVNVETYYPITDKQVKANIKDANAWVEKEYKRLGPTKNSFSAILENHLKQRKL